MQDDTTLTPADKLANSLSGESEATPDDLERVLFYIAGMQPPFHGKIRNLLGVVAEANTFDALATQRVIDVLANHTGESVGTLRKTLAEQDKRAQKARDAAAARAGRSLVAKYIIVEDAGALWRLSPPGWIPKSTFLLMHGVEDGPAALEPVAGMTRVARSTYVPMNPWAPGFDRNLARWVWDPDHQEWMLNLWEPPNFTPARDVHVIDVLPWLHHLDYVVQLDPSLREHVLDCFAHTLQRPGEKRNHGLLLGGEQGVGKDALIEPLIRGLGQDNVYNVTAEQVLEGFDSERMAMAALVILQELDNGSATAAKRLQAYNRAKRLFASPPHELEINIKGVKQYMRPNNLNCFAGTNTREPLAIEQGDRRLAFAWCDGERPDRAYFNRLWEWYDAGGAAFVVGWLLQRDLSRFDPRAHPPESDWKAEVREDSLTMAARTLAAVIDDKEGPGGLEVATAEDLLGPVRQRMIADGVRDLPQLKSIRRALDTLGYRSRRVDEPMLRARAAGRRDARQVRFYLLRRAEYWREAPAAAFFTSTGEAPYAPESPTYGAVVPFPNPEEKSP